MAELPSRSQPAELSLSGIPLFSHLTEEELALFKQRTKFRRLDKGQIIIHQSDPGSALYIIHEGSVNVSHVDPNGKEIIMCVLRSGDYFGEMALLDGEPRSANVATREPCEVSMMQKRDFDLLLNSTPALAMNLLKGLCRRLRQADDMIEMLALSNVYERVVRLLLDQACSDEDGDMVILERLTHRDIAARIGSSREMVSRILSALVEADHIEVAPDRQMIKLNPSLADIHLGGLERH